MITFREFETEIEKNDTIKAIQDKKILSSSKNKKKRKKSCSSWKNRDTLV